MSKLKTKVNSNIHSDVKLLTNELNPWLKSNCLLSEG